MKRLFWLLFFLSSPAWANTYYVSISGNNANACTPNATGTSAKRNILNGVGCLSGGDTLRIQDGTYTNTALDLIYNMPAGTSIAPTIIECEHPLLCIIRPSGELTPGSTAPQMIRTDVAWVTLRNMTIDGINAHSGQVIKIDYPGATNNVVSGNDISGGYCNLIHGIGADLHVIGNHLHHDQGKVDIVNNNQGCYACYCSVNGTLIFDGNTVNNMTGYGLQAYPASDFAIVRNNIFHDNSGVTVSNPPYRIENLCFPDVVVYGQAEIYNNIFYNTKGGGINVKGDGSLLYNNTAWNIGAGQPGCEYGGSGDNVPVQAYSIQANNVTTKNNLTLASGANGIDEQSGHSGNVYTNNLCDATNSQCVLASTSATEFVSTGAANFHLNAGAVSRNAGANLYCIGCAYNSDRDGVSRPQSTAWDIGAYQFTSGTVPPPVNLSPLEDFEYTTSSDLSAQMCTNGSIHCNNWTGPWSLNSGVITVEVAPTGSFSGGNAARSQSGSQNWYNRTIGALSTGSIIWQMRTSTTSAEYQVVAMQDSNLANFSHVTMFNDGHFWACKFIGTEVDLGTFAANTWYLLEANFDLAGHPNQWRVRINEGAFSAWMNSCQATIGQVDRFVIYDSSSTAHDFWVDTIGAKSTSLTYSTQPVGPYNTGSTFSVGVAIKYSDGTTTHTSDTTSISIGLCAGGPAGTFGGTTPVVPVSGVSTFSNLSVTATNGGSGYNLCATASGLVSATSNPFDITGANQSPGVPGHRPRIRIRIR